MAAGALEENPCGLCGLDGRREVFSFLCPALLQRVTQLLQLLTAACPPSSLLCTSASPVQSGVAFNDTQTTLSPEKPVPSSCDKDRKAEPSPPCHCRCHSQPRNNEAATSGTPSAPPPALHPDTGASRKPGSPLTNTGNFTAGT